MRRIEPAEKVAAVRREGYGTWRIMVVVEGFDEEFVHVVSGKHSKEFACAMARVSVGAQLYVRTNYIHIQSATRET